MKKHILSGKYLRRLLAVVMSFCMVFGCLPGSGITAYGDESGQPGQNNQGRLRFFCQSQAVSGGSIYYKPDDASDFTKVSETENQYASLDVSTVSAVTIRIAVNEGYQLDTTRGITLRIDGAVKYSATPSELAEFTGASGKRLDLSAWSTDMQNASFELEFGFENSGNGGNGGGTGGASHTFDYPDNTTANLDIKGVSDFYINGVPAQENTLTYSYDKSSDKVEFEFYTLINERYTSILINGIDYSDQIPGYKAQGASKTDAQIEAEVLEAINLNGNNQTSSVILLVPRAEQYVVEASRKEIGREDEVYWPVGNFLWTGSEPQNAPAGNEESDCIKGGKIEIVSAEYDGIKYSDGVGSKNRLTGENGLLGSKCYFAWEERIDAEGGTTGDGSAVFPYGTRLTIRLIPDYGKQLVAFGVNGGVFTCGESVSTYTFTVARGNFHLNARFEEVDNAVSAEQSSGIAGGRIALGEREIDTGSVVLRVSDAAPSTAEQTAFADAADGYTVDSYLDLDLNQVIYKGSKTAYWSNQMSTLTNAATISLNLKDTIEGGSVEIIHQKHDGTYEVIPAEYDSVAKTLTFSANSFSKYAIAYKHTEHKYGAWKTTKQPTALKSGTAVRVCGICGAEETKSIAKLKATIKLNVTKIPLQVGKSTTKVKVTSMTKGDSVASWKSSKPKIATVNSKGKITGKKAGTATITVTLKSGIKKKVKVTVQKKAVTTKTLTVTGKNIKIKNKKLTLKKGKSETLVAVLTPVTSTDKVTYKTSAKKIVTVSKNGKLTAKKPGKAKITITSGKKKVKITVTVKK